MKKPAPREIEDWLEATRTSLQKFISDLKKRHTSEVRRLKKKIEELKVQVEIANDGFDELEERAETAEALVRAGQEYCRYLGRELDKLQPPKEIPPNIFLLSENHKDLHNEQDRLNAHSAS